MHENHMPLEHDEEGRAFLQQRTARFGLVAGGLGLFFFLFRGAITVSGDAGRVFAPDRVHHALALLSLFGIWAACRRGIHSVRYVRAVEATGVLLACTFYAAMGIYLPGYTVPHRIVILAVGLGMIARAIYVPSSGLRTLVLTGLSGIPVIVSTYFMYHDMDVAHWRPIEPEFADLGAAGITRLYVAFTAAWWAGIMAICFGGSWVIYGLRREVQDVRKLGQYTLTEKLGEGGMGIVYKARHAMLRRPTAVKLLPTDKAGAESVRRFEKEVQLTAMLTHPSTVTIYDYGRTPEGVFYYAMELLDGANLMDVIEVDGAQPPARVIKILLEAAGALGEAHAIGLIHRDVKPANIMLVKQGGELDVAKVVDFGLVKELRRSEEEPLTDADTIKGTPAYLPPEAVRAPDTVDGRSDLYALGAVGYFLLTGADVFDGATIMEVCAQHLQSEPIPPSERLGRPVPADLEAVLLQCLAKDPTARPQTALELQQALLGCDDCGAWTGEEAQAWWDRHGPALAARRDEEALSGAGLRMPVAVTDRVGEPGTAARP